MTTGRGRPRRRAFVQLESAARQDLMDGHNNSRNISHLCDRNMQAALRSRAWGAMYSASSQAGFARARSRTLARARRSARAKARESSRAPMLLASAHALSIATPRRARARANARKKNAPTRNRVPRAPAKLFSTFLQLVTFPSFCAICPARFFNIFQHFSSFCPSRAPLNSTSFQHFSTFFNIFHHFSSLLPAVLR